MEHPGVPAVAEVFSAPYGLPYESVFETNPYPRYNFDLDDKGPAILPVVYAKAPSLFSVAISTPSIGGVAGSQTGDGASQFRDFVSVFQKVCLFNLAL